MPPINQRQNHMFCVNNLHIIPPTPVKLHGLAHIYSLHLFCNRWGQLSPCFTKEENEMNKTAISIIAALFMLLTLIPSPALAASPWPSPTPTAPVSPVPTAEPTPVASPEPSAEPTPTASPEPTASPKPTDTPEPTASPESNLRSPRNPQLPQGHPPPAPPGLRIGLFPPTGQGLRNVLASTSTFTAAIAKSAFSAANAPVRYHAPSSSPPRPVIQGLSAS